MNPSDPHIIHATLAQIAALLQPWAPGYDPRHPQDPRDLLRAWGSPVNMPVPAGPSDIPAEHLPAWGRVSSIAIGQPTGAHNAVKLALPKAEEITVCNQVIGFPTPNTFTGSDGTTQTFFPWMNVQWGNGSAQCERSYRCDDVMSISVVGSWIRVTPYLGDVNGTVFKGSDLGAGVTAPQMQIASFAAIGSRPKLGQAVRWAGNLSAPANAGKLINIPCQLIGVRAHMQAAGAAPLFLQLFDQTTTPVNGNVPLDEFVVDAGATRPWFNTEMPPLPFAQACCYGFSSTSGTLTLAGAGIVRVARLDV